MRWPSRFEFWLLLTYACWVLTAGATGHAAQPDRELAHRKRQIYQWIVGEETELAVPALESLVKDYPADVTLHLWLGEAYYLEERYDEAVVWFEAGLKRRPNLRGRTFNLARSYHKLNELAKAEEIYALMKKQPNAALRAKAHFGLGLVREEQGRDSEARAAYEQSVAIDANSHRPRYRLGMLLLHRGDLAAAERHFRVVLEKRPLHHGAAFNASLALYRQGKGVEADQMRARYDRILKGKQKVSGLRSQLRQDPRDWLTMAALATEYQALGAQDEARRWAGRALGILEEQGDDDEARRLRERFKSGD